MIFNAFIQGPCIHTLVSLIIVQAGKILKIGCMYIYTLTYLIIVQDVINVQAGKFPGINKRAGCNKAVQVGIFQESIVKKTCRLEKFQKLINVQDVIRLCRLDFFKKIIICAARLLDI